jgi:UDP-N-acetylmuramate: L-alanyl-gamma-D-glutamyl-meso-diaminopimelate ligase
VALAAPYHATRLGADALDVERLVAELAADGKVALTTKDAASLADALLPRLAPGDVVLAMSSGSFGGIHGRLLEGLRRAESGG